MQLSEIYTIRSREFDGEEDLRRYERIYAASKRDLKPLGDTNFLYTVVQGRADGRVWIFAADKEENLIAVLSLDEPTASIDEASHSVDAVVVSPEYRGRGIAQLLYKVAIYPRPNGLGITLVSGESQTAGGKKTWAKFEADPNVEITGFFLIHGSIIDPELHGGSAGSQDAGELLDDLFGRIGAQFEKYDRGFYIFTFPVKFLKSRIVGQIETELLRLYTKMPRDYSSGITIKSGMFAQYRG
jgi:GNAT superfamily N-acetyltransferase